MSSFSMLEYIHVNTSDVTSAMHDDSEFHADMWTALAQEMMPDEDLHNDFPMVAQEMTDEERELMRAMAQTILDEIDKAQDEDAD